LFSSLAEAAGTAADAGFRRQADWSEKGVNAGYWTLHAQKRAAAGGPFRFYHHDV
jgi:hypothetical protein